MPGIICSPLLRGTELLRLPIAVLPKPEGEPDDMPGPLKTERFRRAKTGRPGEPRGMLPKVGFASLKTGRLPSVEGGGRRETRMPDGNDWPVGVEGSTFTDACGERPILDPEAEETPEGETIDALDVEEALECVCWWCALW